jgi:hypothetical protein
VLDGIQRTILINVMYGAGMQGVDNAAHFGGFICTSVRGTYARRSFLRCCTYRSIAQTDSCCTLFLLFLVLFMSLYLCAAGALFAFLFGPRLFVETRYVIINGTSFTGAIPTLARAYTHAHISHMHVHTHLCTQI